MKKSSIYKGLRIGNYVHCKGLDQPYYLVQGVNLDNADGGYVVVKDRLHTDPSKEVLIFSDKAEGIPIDDEWLIRLGFERDSSLDIWVYSGESEKLLIRWLPSPYQIVVVDEHDETMIGDLKTVHELQNWIYAVTSIELQEVCLATVGGEEEEGTPMVNVSRYCK